MHGVTFSGLLILSQTIRKHTMTFAVKSVPSNRNVVVVEVDALKMKHKATVYHEYNENLAKVFDPGKSPSATFTVSFPMIQRFTSFSKKFAPICN